MEIDLILSNPPFVTKNKLGGKIIRSAREFNPHAQISILMPLTNYKFEDLSKFVDKSKLSLTGSDYKLFNAKIPANTVITTLNTEPNEEQLYKDLEWSTYKDSYLDFYRKNNTILINSDRPYNWKTGRGKPYTDFDLKHDFIEIDRANQKGSGHGKASNAYQWNVEEKDYEDRWFDGIKFISFDTHQGKKNFSDWWYFEGKCQKICNNLSTKLGWGLNKRTMDSLAIPQIDWEHIDKNQKELWSKGDFDKAVMEELNLEYNEEKDEIKEKKMFESVYAFSNLELF